MNATLLSISDLLERSGFRIHGRGNRADCRQCDGKLTIAFSEVKGVAFCHRCHFKTNARLLAKELRLSLPPQDSKEVKTRAVIARFEDWRNRKAWGLIHQLWYLRDVARRATEVLKLYPDCEPAWGALARLYNSEAKINKLLDFVLCTQGSQWLEVDAKIVDVFTGWRRA